MRPHYCWRRPPPASPPTLADARKIQAFIRSLGTPGKSDGLDARGIACYGLERHAQLPRWTPRKGALTDLQAFIRLRAQLVTQRAGLRSLLQAPNSEAVKGHVHTMIKHLDHQIQAVEDDIAARLHDERCVSETVARVEQIPGCGRLTAITLAVLMPELGRLTRRQAAALAGLAPHPHQSRQRAGYRRTRGGRPEICPCPKEMARAIKGTQSDKRALFMAALSASRYNLDLKTFYKRLIKNGKKPIVALTATMRKLITITNARLRDAANTPKPKLSR